MHKKLALVFSLVLTLAFTSPAMAQDLSALDGLESAYGRIYMVDTEALVATPGATASLDAGDLPIVARAAVYTFRDDDAAAGNTEELADMVAVEAFEGAEAEKEALDGIGDAGYRFTAQVEIEEGTIAGMVVVVVQDEERVLVVAIVGGEDPDGMGTDWAEFMVDADIEDDEVQLSDDGTSTGGPFDLLPGADDQDLLAGLAPIADLDVIEEAGP